MRLSPGVRFVACLVTILVAHAPAGFSEPASLDPQAAPRPAAPASAKPAPAASVTLPSIVEERPPSEAELGVPVYPSARFLRSYDAGRGQRFYLFGAQASFTEIVAYYRTILKDRGELVFERPATHFFETGRFREDTMAVTPGVTVKDFTATGSPGYPSSTPGATPSHYPTVIQIVPVGAAARR